MKFLTDDIKSLLEDIDEQALSCLNEHINDVQEEVYRKILTKNNEKYFFQNYSRNYIKSLLSNHIYFMKEFFNIKVTQMIFNHLTWEISTYTKMGISSDFFKYLLLYFKEALISIDPKCSLPIIKFYSSLHDNYETLYTASTHVKTDERIPNEKSIYQEFIKALLEPNLAKAIAISNDFIKNREDLQAFFEHILLLSLYNIGAKWSNGEITVGQEHTATSICQRVMSIHYEKILDIQENLTKVLVCVSPRELHEVGARMISDLLEFHGYDTYFFGSQFDKSKLLDTIKEEQIENILISTTVVSNLGTTNEMIKEIRETINNDKLKIYVGGQAYEFTQDVTNNKDIDAYIPCFDRLLEVLKEE